ncbi:MAG: hypothetical protein LBT70_02210 [Holosporaceae bacterium]|jgi:hypothetical protein|nr:hypothetical protein [Holosporaceae bacterium]
MTEDIKEKKNQTETSQHHECCGGNHKCRFGCAFLVIALILACVVGEYAYRHWNSETTPLNNPVKTTKAIGAKVLSGHKNYDAQIEEIKKSLDDLRNMLNTVQTIAQNTKMQLQTTEIELKKLSSTSFPHNLENLAQENRKKWKIWMNLKNKIENNDDYAAEFELFCSVFADDEELISLVKDIAQKDGVLSSQEKKGIIESCSSYLKRIVRIKKINHAKLFEISGYVLSSIKR